MSRNKKFIVKKKGKVMFEDLNKIKVVDCFIWLNFYLFLYVNLNNVNVIILWK